MFLLLLLVARVAAYPRGAPNSKCLNLEPGHHMEPQDNKVSPYSIQVGQVQVPPSTPVVLTLAASQQTFRGFIVQARDERGKVIGTFEITQDDSKYLHCSGGPQSSVTHRDAREKQEVWLRWFPPAQFQGEVSFLATFVKDYNTYWVGISSAPVLVERRKPVASEDFVDDEPDLEEFQPELEEFQPELEEFQPELEEFQPFLDLLPSLEQDFLEQDFLEQDFLEDMHGEEPHEYEELLAGLEEDYEDEDIHGGIGNGEFFREDYFDEKDNLAPGGWAEADVLPPPRPPPPFASPDLMEEMEVRRKEVEDLDRERIDNGTTVEESVADEKEVGEDSSTKEDHPKPKGRLPPYTAPADSLLSHLLRPTATPSSRPPPSTMPDVAPLPHQYQPRYDPRHRPQYPQRRPPTPWWMRPYTHRPPPSLPQYPRQPQYYMSRMAKRRKRSAISPYSRAQHRRPYSPAYRQPAYSYSPREYHRPYRPSSRFSYRAHYSNNPTKAYGRYRADAFRPSYLRRSMFRPSSVDPTWRRARARGQAGHGAYKAQPGHIDYRAQLGHIDYRAQSGPADYRAQSGPADFRAQSGPADYDGAGSGGGEFTT